MHPEEATAGQRRRAPLAGLPRSTPAGVSRLDCPRRVEGGTRLLRVRDGRARAQLEGTTSRRSESAVGVDAEGDGRVAPERPDLAELLLELVRRDLERLTAPE